MLHLKRYDFGLLDILIYSIRPVYPAPLRATRRLPIDSLNPLPEARSRIIVLQSFYKDLDDDNMKQNLTPEELARIAGGFGATDESVAQLLNKAMQRDLMIEKEADSLNDAGHSLQGEYIIRSIDNTSF